MTATIALLVDDSVDSQEAFSVWEVARLASGRNGDRTGAFLQASSPPHVAEVVPRIADVLVPYGERALRGDLAFRRKLRAQQQMESVSFLSAGRAAFLRQATARAWKAGDYAEVVRLLSETPEALGAAERKKLEFARKHVTRD